jgi:hypothetical protein
MLKGRATLTKQGDLDNRRFIICWADGSEVDVDKIVHQNLETLMNYPTRDEADVLVIAGEYGEGLENGSTMVFQIVKLPEPSRDTTEGSG